MNQNKIGLFIKRKRIEKGLTQEQLANRLYISSKTISRWERGLNIPDISILRHLSIELGVSVNELMLGDENIETFDPNTTILYSEKEKILKIKKTKKLLFILLIVLLILLFDVSYGYFSTSLNWQISNRLFAPHGLLFSLIFKDIDVLNIEGIYLTQMFYIFINTLLFNFVIVIILVYLSYLENKLETNIK